jgi:hypothetical protein
VTAIGSSDGKAGKVDRQGHKFSVVAVKVAVSVFRSLRIVDAHARWLTW